MFVKKMTAIAAVALLTSVTSAHAANEGVYGEIAYTSSSIAIQGFSGSWAPSALRGVVGAGLNDNLALEGMLLLGMSDSTNLGLAIKLQSGAGFYLKPRAKLGEAVEVFARLGWANINTKVNTLDAKDNGASYGAGASYSFSKTTSVNLDYMLYNDSNGSKIAGVSVGLGFKF